MTKTRTTLWALGLVACGGSAGPAAETAHSNPPNVAPTPSAASPLAAPTPAPAAANAPPPSPFKVIGELPMQAKLFGMGERGFVVAQEGILFSLVGDDVVHDPLIQRGLDKEVMFSVDGIMGSWPDAAWLATSHPAGRTGFTKLWRWDGKRWVHKQSTSPSNFVTAIRPWIGGRQLAVEQAVMMFDARFRVVSGDKNVTLPVPATRKTGYSFCTTELQVQAFETLPGGEIFSAGQRCNDEGVFALGAERWAAGAKQGVVDTLPGTNIPDGGDTYFTVNGIAARSPSDVLVSAQKEVLSGQGPTRKRETFSYLAHFDGTSWKTVDIDLPSSITSLALGSDGTLFVTTERGELFTGKSPGSLVPVPLPAALAASGSRLEVESYWSKAPGDLWAIVATTRPNRGGLHVAERRFLVHTRPATSALPTFEQFVQKERAYRLPGPPVEWCTTPFVLLYTLGKKAPADYDYPSTREALKGHREFGVEGVEFLEFERTGTRFFGARVPDFSLGKKLADLVKEKVVGSTPQLVCHDPPELRKLDIDLATGALKK